MPTKIEWCDETLNPFWGCTHGCSYCQARRIAHMRAERIGKPRGYSPEVIEKMKRFEPVWLPDAYRILGQILKWTKSKTIFIGFMGDVACQPKDKIKYIFKIAKIHDQHRFLILTKNLSALCPFSKYKNKNVWIGYSDDGVRDAFLLSLNLSKFKNTFVSYEPLIGPDIYINRLHTRWIIIGALTDRRGQPVPAEKGGTRLEWVMPIIEIADKNDIPVFLKNNLLKLYPQLPKRQEFPWR
ncbi:MAG: DUF5131 family protein [Nitrospirae bacterium]|nr:DUF5131 family protein [Nitrospirota bacterium]